MQNNENFISFMQHRWYTSVTDKLCIAAAVRFIVPSMPWISLCLFATFKAAMFKTGWRRCQT